MATETRYPDTVDAIVSAWTAAGLKVWDGPIVSGDYGDAVYVGYDADPEAAEFKAADLSQEWAELGARRRNEDLSIVCAAVVLQGADATSWKPVRDAIFAMYDKAGQALRAAPGLSQAPPFVVEILFGSLFQEPGPQGFQARIVFTVHVKSRV